MFSLDEPPQEIDGRFSLEGERIAGGMGTVYRGVDRTTGKTVAVKISSNSGAEFGDRFQQEANCLAEIAHPAIVRYIAHGKTARNEHYLVMEWLDGETLEDRLGRGAIPLGITVHMIRRVAEALAVAHQHGVIHRDIKPANIFLPDRDTSRIKLLDFGIARRLFDAPSLRLTQAGSALGTPMYMSPEQAQGRLDMDGRADVFSLGCVFFECLTGKPPFVGETTTVTFTKLTSDEHIDVAARCPGLPARLTELLRRMLAKAPGDRPSSINEVLAEIDSITSDLRVTGVYPIIPHERSGTAQDPLLVATGERRLAAVIVVSPGVPLALLQPPASATTSAPQDDMRLVDISREVGHFGALIQRLANGSLVVSFAGEARTTPLDLASRAARCALKLKSVRPGSSLGISLGYAVKDEELRFGGLVESAADLLGEAHLGAVHVNQEVRRLLETRFEIVAEPDGRARLLFEKGLRDIPRTVLGHEVPCFGRDREVRNLEGLFEECMDESSAQAMIVSGGPGCGKSRVAHEFIERARDSGHAFELLVGRGDPMRGNVSLGLLAQALRGAAGVSGTEPDEIQRKRLLAHTTRFLTEKAAPTTAAFLGEIAGIHFPDDDLPQLRAARQDARVMADQTMGAWVDWLEAEVRHHPVLLLLEDLHWGDAPSVNYVDTALRVLRKQPLMVLALARPEVDQRFHGLWRDRQLQHIALSPLTNRAGQEIVRRVLGDVAPETMAWLLDNAQGNPFYLEELVRAADGPKRGRAIPNTILGTVQARFDAVGEGAKLVLRAASVYGQSFLAAGVNALVGEMSAEDVSRWLDILVAKEILFARALGSARQHVFRHALLHEAAYAMLSPGDEVVGHRLAGTFLEKSGERDAIVLADHFEKGADPVRAIRWLRVAANQAMEVNDLNAAVERVERGARLGAQGDDLAELRVVESEARYWRGEYADAERAGWEARKCDNPKLALRAASALISALGVQTKYDEIERLSKEIETRPEDPRLLHSWLVCMVDVTSYLAWIGKHELRERTLALIEAAGPQVDPFLLGRAHSMRSHVTRSAGKLGDALVHVRQAHASFEQAGHRREASEALANLGVSQLEIGLLDEAESSMRRLLDSVERTGLDGMLGGVLQALTNILAYRGCIDEARAVGQRAVALTRQQGDAHFQGSAEIYLSLVEFMAGQYPVAEQLSRQALVSFQGNPLMTPFPQAMLARILLASGRISEASDLAQTAYDQFESLGTVDDGEATVRLARVECLLASGNTRLADATLGKAIERLLVQAANIDDQAWRRAFLEKIPENRHLVELANERGLAHPPHLVD
jgi:serine/threonine protein kinase/tetratricopeptide (TPR) repeat protein